MRLEKLQMDFFRALLDTSSLPAIAPNWTGGDRVLDRLALYHADLLATREKALGNAYPVVRTLVGVDFFSGLARAYGNAHPSADGDLNRFGAQFTGLISSTESARALPYLADVAALEWLLHRAHYAADATPLSRAYVASLSASELLHTTFRLHPACAWLGSRFPIASIWQAHQPGSGVALPDAVERSECALVARPSWRAEVHASTPGEIAALSALQSGQTMETVIGEALNAEPDFAVARSLVRWLDLDLLVEPSKTT